MRGDEAKTDLVDGAGQPVTYAALVERAPATVTAEQAEEVFATKLARTGAALDALAARIDAEGLDAMIVVGDDQAEHLGPENLPPVLVYHGPTLRNTRAEVNPDAPPDLAELIRGYHEPDADVDYPVDVELALGLINHLLDHGFDVATSARLPKPRAEGHALQFPHRRLLRPELPVVPVLLNTYMPPSQPRAARCFDLGVALAAAVESIARDRRIGFLASGVSATSWCSPSGTGASSMRWPPVTAGTCVRSRSRSCSRGRRSRRTGSPWPAPVPDCASPRSTTCRGIAHRPGRARAWRSASGSSTNPTRRYARRRARQASDERSYPMSDDANLPARPHRPCTRTSPGSGPAPPWAS